MPREMAPPNSMESEAALIGAAIQDAAKALDGSIRVVPTDFYQPAHQTIWAEVLRLWEADGKLDMVTLTARLKQDGSLDRVGGLDYLLQLAESTPSAEGAPHYARQVLRCKALRDVADMCATVRLGAYAGNDPVSLMDSAAATFDAIRGRLKDHAQRDKLLGVAVSEVAKKAEQIMSGELAYEQLLTGYQRLDESLLMCPGDYIIVGARPSVGKTAVALQLGLGMAKIGTPGAFFSIEMSVESLARRVLASIAGVDQVTIRRPGPNTNWELIQGGVGSAQGVPLYLVECPSLTLFDLKAEVRRLKRTVGIKWFAVDYIGLMRPPSAENRTNEVRMLSGGIKSLAMGEKLVALICCQLNRQSAARENKRPSLSDLREAGDLEQDADAVVLLHREDYVNRDDASWVKRHDIELLGIKQRNGPAFTALMGFDEATQRLTDDPKVAPIRDAIPQFSAESVL